MGQNGEIGLIFSLSTVSSAYVITRARLSSLPILMLPSFLPSLIDISSTNNIPLTSFPSLPSDDS